MQKSISLILGERLAILIILPAPSGVGLIVSPYYQEYYKDKYIMSTVITSCKDDAAEVFDMALDHNPDGDLGAIIRGMRHHYCGSLTFQEQCNAVENMQQGTNKDAAEFLVRVNSAVWSLGKDWQGTISPEELETLKFKVAMNGVKQDISYVLDSEATKYGQLSSKQIYDAVKRYEAYVAHNKCLVGRSPYVGNPRDSGKAPTSAGYQPWYPKVNTFAAQAVKEGGPPPEETELEAATEEGIVELDPALADEEVGGVYIPDFQSLTGSTDVHCVSVQMAQAIQADEQLKRQCFVCQSPDHFIRDCPQAKNGKRPLPLRGPPKNNSASSGGKAKIQPFMPTPPVQQPTSPPQKLM